MEIIIVTSMQMEGRSTAKTALREGKNNLRILTHYGQFGLT